MALHPIDWAVVALYVAFALWVGARFSRRAGQSVDEYFLSGRTLPWWIAGTSMVATTFSLDTPLYVTGLVRDSGIWKNWQWWCFGLGTGATVFLFAPYWRRAEVLTTAELSELRYGGSGARVLRGFLGFLHACVTNVIVLSWVLLAWRKMAGPLFGLEPWQAIVGACAVSLAYSMLAGFWGVVVTDLLQFAIAMAGAIALAVLAWDAAGGTEGIVGVLESSGHVLDFVPLPEEGGAWWSASLASFAVYLGVAWWAKDGVDGGGVVVQRISASRDVRQGILASLWYVVGNFALRPWPWIAVALASLIVLPANRVLAPASGVIAELDGARAMLAPRDGAAPLVIEWTALADDWRPEWRVERGDEVERGDVLASTDSEQAYVVMMTRYLPVGLLGLVLASVLAAFMSTVDTHVNLASSYFVNDVYRRFVARDREQRHYVLVARVASALVLALAGALAASAESIRELFTFFLALLGGVGPIYVLRWFWWRVRASTEIAAMLASVAAAGWATFGRTSGWELGLLSPGGVLSDTGRICVVVGVSASAALLSLALTRAPDPARLVTFYRQVRPLGFWGPVRRLAPEVRPALPRATVLRGVAGAWALTFGCLFGIGHLLLGHPREAALSAALALLGALWVRTALDRSTSSR